MKKLFMVSLLLASVCVSAQDNKKEEPVMKKEKGEFVVNTTTICDARGFKGPTPVMVYFKKDKIVKVVELPVRETPRFYERVIKELFPKFENLDMDKSEEVDCVTGATISSRAVKANVEAAKKYYLENKSKRSK